MEDGTIVLLTGYAKTLMILRDATGLSQTERPAPISLNGYDNVSATRAEYIATVGELDYSRWLFHWKCSSCHTLEGEAYIAPPLKGVIGREIGSVEDFPYSLDLQEADGKWTRKKVSDYLDKPADRVPGHIHAPAGA